LDGRDIVLRSPPGKVTRPGDVLVVQGQGMPIFQGDNSSGARTDKKPKCGRFLVTMDVQFPPDNSFSEQDIGLLKRIIPSSFG